MKGICHAEAEYSIAGLVPLQEHIKNFFQFKEFVPVCRTENHISGKYIYFIFSVRLLKQFLEDQNRICKPYECAIKYGFRGYSTGGRNGIFYQRKQDVNLLKTTDKLILQHEDEIRTFMVDTSDINGLKKIKIVCHNSKGQRLVGVFEEVSRKALFLDWAEY
jgi:hypothetical protein